MLPTFSCLVGVRLEPLFSVIAIERIPVMDDFEPVSFPELGLIDFLRDLTARCEILLYVRH